MSCKLLFNHIRSGHVRFKCKCCSEKTWHEFVENKSVIRTRNRSGKRRFGVFKQHFGCVLMATEYFLNEYFVYRCSVCGRLKNIPGSSKRISKEKAQASGLEIMHNWGFGSRMHW